MPYVVQIEPDGRLRLLTLASGLFLHVLGVALLTGVPLAFLPKVMLVALWLGLAWRELRRQIKGYRRVVSIRIHEDGALECVSVQGATERVRLLGGSLVLPRWAWLRLKFADGRHYGELLSGNAERQSEWHGLQLTRTQCGVRFGRVE